MHILLKNVSLTVLFICLTGNLIAQDDYVFDELLVYQFKKISEDESTISTKSDFIEEVFLINTENPDYYLRAIASEDGLYAVSFYNLNKRSKAEGFINGDDLFNRNTLELPELRKARLSPYNWRNPGNFNYEYDLDDALHNYTLVYKRKGTLQNFTIVMKKDNISRITTKIHLAGLERRKHIPAGGYIKTMSFTTKDGETTEILKLDTLKQVDVRVQFNDN